MKNKNIFCTVCGRKCSKLKFGMCNKHYAQFKKYGFALDSNPRNDTDPNEIIENEEYVEIVLYDSMQEELSDRVIIDKDEIDKIKDIRWNKLGKLIVGEINNSLTNIDNFIMETDKEIIHKNNIMYDCRKENLEIHEVKKHHKQILPPITKKNKNKIILEFIGESVNGVTGSGLLIHVPKKDNTYETILIELGMVQLNGRIKDEYLTNLNIVKKVPFDNISAVFVCHSHADHTALLPSLYSHNYQGKIYTTIENRYIMSSTLVDSTNIFNKNIKLLQSKKHNVNCIFSEADVDTLIYNTLTFEPNEIHKLDDIISFEFIPSGHIIGAYQLLLFVKMPTGNIKKIHYTSDLGCAYNRDKFVDCMEKIPNSTVSIFESTYSDIIRQFNKLDIDKERKKLKQIITKELNNNHRILIPAFALGRTATILSFLYDNFSNEKWFDKYPIYLDGKLSLELNQKYLCFFDKNKREYWEKILLWKNLHYIKDYESSLNTSIKKDPCIAISSSGMINNGRILNWCKTMIEDKKSAIIFIGYCADGTIGSQILSDSTLINIEGLEYVKKCKVYKMNTFSSHIQHDENINYMKSIHTNLIILHHGDVKNKVTFRGEVEDILRSHGNTARVICATDKKRVFFV